MPAPAAGADWSSPIPTCKKAFGVAEKPIPILPAEVIRIFSVAAVVSVPPAFVQKDKAVGELRLLPTSLTIANLPASLMP